MASKKEDACKYEFTTTKMCLQLAIIHGDYYGRMITLLKERSNSYSFEGVPTAGQI